VQRDIGLSGGQRTGTFDDRVVVRYDLSEDDR